MLNRILPRLPDNLIVKTLVVTAGILIFLLVLAFPARSFFHYPSQQPVDGFSGFTGAEKDQNGTSFAWAGPEARLEYAQVPRYSPLNLRLRLGLKRPANAEAAQIKVYENSLDPAGETKLIGTLIWSPVQQDVIDYRLTVPPRPSGKGVLLTFDSNTFKVPNDRRELAFVFVESEISLPKTHFFNLFWPNPIWFAGLLLLSAIVAWSLRSGLTVVETLLLAGMLAYLLVSITPSTYQYSWWLLLVALAVWLIYYLDYSLKHLQQAGNWLLVLAVGLLVIFFLFTPDTHSFDIKFYQSWGASVHQYGIWNIYNHAPTLDYLPLIVYILWIYNLFAYPLGLENNEMAWRVFMSGLFVALVVFVAWSQWQSDKTKADKIEPASIKLWLILVGFNAAMFYNPAIYGQTDIIPVLALVITFYFAFRRQVIPGGLALGLTVISKPQTYFILPVVLWVYVQWCGWKKVFQVFILGGIVAVTLAAIAFGMDINSVFNYVNRPEFAGEYTNDIPTAFSLSYLVLGEARDAPPIWLNLTGFGLVGLVLLWLLVTNIRKGRQLVRAGLAANLLGLACFTFLIKMKERYLFFGLPFIGMAAWQQRKYRIAFLVLSWLQLIHLVISLYYTGPWGRRGILNQFYLWDVIASQDWAKKILSVGTIAVFFWLAYQYYQETRAKVIEAKPEMNQKITE